MVLCLKAWESRSLPGITSIILVNLMILKILISWTAVLVISIYPIEKLSEYVVDKQLKSGVRGVFLSKENYSYLKYINETHHVRDVVQWTGFTKELNIHNNLLFSVVNPNTNINEDQGLVLINGDSWAEMTFWKNIPNKIISDYAINENLKIVASGISSFSASPMAAQLNILRRDFDINPNKIISFFDYTDIGDELCRYKPKLLTDNQNLTLVRPETYESIEVYSDLLLLLNKFKIFYDEKLYSIQKLIYYSFERMNYYLADKDEVMRCRYSKIAKPLIEGLSVDEILYIEKVVHNYFNEVFKDDNVEKLFIVLHPHRNHYYEDQALDKYKVQWRPILDKIINDKKLENKIKVIDFNDYFPEIYEDEGINIENIFIEGDISSHLVEKAHGIMLEKILEIVDKK